MFSYRHAFHAGNHADVLKHLVLVAILRHLTQKPTALQVVDTHAGAGLYRLDTVQAHTSAEAEDGILRLVNAINRAKAGSGIHSGSAALNDYLELVKGFNPSGGWTVYPGSPFLIQHLLGDRDRLKLFELHPTDTKLLTGNIEQLKTGRQVAILREDGFEGLKKFLPPPSRRGLVLCDPSYELKTDYTRVVKMTTDALQRFATGTYMIWYPNIARMDAQELPRKLWNLAVRCKRPWLHCSLDVGRSDSPSAGPGTAHVRPGLSASGLFVINPPYTLNAALKEALPELIRLLGRDKSARFSLDSGE
jgi:23S rRNA (adenine2030-N6)-methyltransferase